MEEGSDSVRSEARDLLPNEPIERPHALPLKRLVPILLGLDS
jgi:hypothetical protein